MKKSSSQLLRVIIFASILFLPRLYSQVIDPDDPTGTIETQLTAVVKNQFGENYRCAFSVLDSAIKRNESTHDGGELTDPYNTLHGYILFGADKKEVGDEEHGIMGIYENGQIIWHSDSLFKGEWHGIFAIKDINRDGKVDILVDWTPGSQSYMVDHLWIISWDGSTGTIINQTKAENGNTTIHASESMFDLIETDTTSPILIRGNWPSEEDFADWFPNAQISTLPYVTYGWNGSKYGLWPGVMQIAGNQYLPANRLSVLVKCDVIKFQDSLSFQYYWTNSVASKQRLEKFSLVGVKKSFYPIQPRGWMFWGWWIDLPVAAWEVQGLDQFKMSLPAGKSQNGIIIHAQALPAIAKFYVQGYRTDPDFGTDHSNYKQLFQNDFFSNSFVSSTIGPADPPSPFVPPNFLDSLSNYTSQSRTLGWIASQATANKYIGYFSTAKTQLQSNNIAGARLILQTVLTDANTDSISNFTSEAYALIRYNTEYLLAQLPLPPSGLNVKLVSSLGAKLTGGSLQYYEGSWKDAVNNNDGTFTINTSQHTLSLRMTYAYGTQTKSNVTIGNDTIIFQTVAAQVKLQNSQGNLIDQGTVQYYSGAWRNFGTTVSGLATKELLPNNYSFRTTYAYASNDKQQDLNSNATVVFQTVNALVQLKNSQGNLMDTGTVQYYSGAWRAFGTTTSGVATKELLPNNYSFRMTYAFASNDKQQNIGTNATVVFQTVNTAVQLKNSQGSLIDQGTVQYYSGAWRIFGSTSSGLATKELLPNNYSFRMTYAFASNDKQQDLNTNSTVVFQTVNTSVQLKDSQGNPIDLGTVQYYSGAWRDFGTTANGITTKELLPNSYQFRITFGFVSNDKTQDVGNNNSVSFSTVLTTVRVKDLQNNPVNNAIVTYYSGAWRQFGNTINGDITKELLPANLQFRAKLGSAQQDKTQNLSTNPLVEITLNVGQ